MTDSSIANSKNQLPVTSEPLWKNFPTRDKNGNALSDFMLIFPGFKKLSAYEIQNKVNWVYNTLNAFGDKIQYASMNLKNNILMISVRPDPGIQLEITAAIQVYVPEAKLVTHM